MAMPINNGWLVRAKPAKDKTVWAGVVLALVSLLVQSLNLWRTDLRPLLELGQKNQASLQRIEKQLEDHERRLTELERARVQAGVIRRVKP